MANHHTSSHTIMHYRDVTAVVFCCKFLTRKWSIGEHNQLQFNTSFWYMPRRTQLSNKLLKTTQKILGPQLSSGRFESETQLSLNCSPLSFGFQSFAVFVVSVCFPWYVCIFKDTIQTNALKNYAWSFCWGSSSGACRPGRERPSMCTQKNRIQQPKASRTLTSQPVISCIRHKKQSASPKRCDFGSRFFVVAWLKERAAFVSRYTAATVECDS